MNTYFKQLAELLSPEDTRPFIAFEVLNISFDLDLQKSGQGQLKSILPLAFTSNGRHTSPVILLKPVVRPQEALDASQSILVPQLKVESVAANSRSVVV